MQFPWFAPPKKVKIGKNSDFFIYLLILCRVLGVQTIEIVLNKENNFFYQMQFPRFAPPKKVKISKNSDFFHIFAYILLSFGVQTMEIALNQKKKVIFSILT